MSENLREGLTELADGLFVLDDVLWSVMEDSRVTVLMMPHQKPVHSNTQPKALKMKFGEAGSIWGKGTTGKGGDTKGKGTKKT